MLIKRIIIDLDYPFIDYKWDNFINFFQETTYFNTKEIVESLFNEYYYYFIIGKYNFKQYIDYVFSLLKVNEKYDENYNKLLNFYQESLNINKEKIYSFINFCKSKNIKISFVINCDEIHYKKLINLIPEFKKNDFLLSSFRLNVTTSDYFFYQAIKDKYGIMEKPEETVFIDDNIDNLLTAKEMGYISLFFDPEVDICSLINKYILSF